MGRSVMSYRFVMGYVALLYHKNGIFDTLTITIGD